MLAGKWHFALLQGLTRMHGLIDVCNFPNHGTTNREITADKFDNERKRRRGERRREGRIGRKKSVEKKILKEKGNIKEHRRTRRT